MRKLVFRKIETLVEEHGMEISMLNSPDIEPDACVYFKTRSWDGGYESGHGFDGTREEYYYDQQMMFQFMRDFIDAFDLKFCIIAPLWNYDYFESWSLSSLRENDIYKNVGKILRQKEIRRKSRSGIDIDLKEEFKILKMFMEGGFRFISRGCFIFPEIGVIIEPHHHMNLYIYSGENKELCSKIEEISEKYEDVGFVYSKDFI